MEINIEQPNEKEYFVCGEPYKRHNRIPDCLSAGLYEEIDYDKDVYYQTGVYGYWDGFDCNTGKVNDVVLHLNEDAYASLTANNSWKPGSENGTIITSFDSTREAYEFYTKWVVDKKSIVIDSVHGYAIERIGKQTSSEKTWFQRLFGGG